MPEPLNVRKVSYPVMVQLDTDGTPMVLGERLVEVRPGEWMTPLGAAVSTAAFPDLELEAVEPLDQTVQGYCPACGGNSLFRAAGGHITCSRSDCPNPAATDEILADRETEHVVQLGTDAFTVRHPLRERLNDELMDCELHSWIADLSGPPRVPGRYRVIWADRSQPSHWEEVRA